MLHDLRLAFRSLRRTPGFTTVVVLTLALGIGANTAIFSVVNGVLLKPLPYRAPGQLMLVWEKNSRGNPRNTVSPANYLDWRDRNRSFSALADFGWSGITLTGGSPEHVEGRSISPEFFRVLDVQPELGRLFTPEEDAPNGPRVLLLSHGLWQRRYGADPSIVGHTIPVAGGDARVVGVMPASVQSMPYGNDQYWEPLHLDPADRKRMGRYTLAIGRLKDGVSQAAAQAEMSAIADQLSREQPQFNTGWGANVVALTEQFVGATRPVLLTLLGAVSLVLLIACANVANLMLVRAAGRRREFAVRAALGAGRRRLIRERLAESLVLAAAGGVAGSLLAAWGIDLLIGAGPAQVPRLAQIGIDGRVLAVTALVTLTVGVVFGLTGAWGSGNGGMAADLHGAGRRTTSGAAASRLRGALVVTQVSLAVVLLVGAGLLVRSLQRLTAVDPGFDPTGVLTVAVDLPQATYPDAARQAAFNRDLLRRARALPGAESAAMIDFLPLGGPGSATSFSVVGRPPAAAGQQPVADIRVADPDYFHTMRIPIRRGRAPSPQDGAGQPPVVIVNETLAQHLWPGADPVGQRIQIEMWDPDAKVEIVGVAGDVLSAGLDQERRPMIYFPAEQAPLGSPHLLIRTQGDPLALAGQVRSAVHDIDHDLPIGEVSTMENYLLVSISDRRFPMFVLSLFAALAVALAAVGIYGVLSHGVGQRTQEIGVRMALGARLGDILALVIGQGAMLVGLGAIAGLAGALALSKVLHGLLFEVTASDPLTYVGVALLLFAVALAAMLLPARRAATVDPVVALKAD
jgi:putative ABC transport system permease protein